jgi:hypothetical protein
MDDVGFDGIVALIEAGVKPPATGARGKRGPTGKRSVDLEAVRASVADGQSFAKACHALGFDKHRTDYLRKLDKSGKK